MKFSQKFIFTMLIFSGILFSVNTQTNIVFADASTTSEEDDSSISDEKIIATLPMYEVTSRQGVFNDAVPLNYTVEIEVDSESFAFYKDVMGGDFGTPIGSRYNWKMPGGFKNRAVYYPSDKKLHDDQQIVDKIYYYLDYFTTEVNFVCDGEIVGTNENIIFDVSPDRGLAINENSPELTPPKGYRIDEDNMPKHKLGEKTDETNIPVIKTNVQPFKLVVIQQVKGTTTEGYITESTDSTIVNNGDNIIIKDLFKSSDYKLTIESEKSHINITDSEGNILDESTMKYEDLINTLNYFSNPGMEKLNGTTVTVNIYYEYDDETNPISYDVTILSNLNSEQVPKVSVSGKKLGEKFEINVPAISGYKSDKAKVLAQVNADGTITTAEKVNYSKTNSNNSHHNNNNQVNINDGITNFNSKLVTTNTADLYDINGNKINQTVASDKSFTTDKKLIKNNKTYYQVEPDKFVKAEDVYIYQDMQGNLRTYAGSYKYLINSQNKTVKNRALSAGSDWAADRIAKFGGQQYYRVATNEWVHVSDVFMYQPHVKVVEIVAGTSLYDERGNTIRSITGTISLKVDRKVTINNQQYYRVATNEYVLVSDIK